MPAADDLTLVERALVRALVAAIVRRGVPSMPPESLLAGDSFVLPAGGTVPALEPEWRSSA